MNGRLNRTLLVLVILLIMSLACECNDKICSDGSSWPCPGDDVKYETCIKGARNGYIGPGCCSGFGICNPAMFKP